LQALITPRGRAELTAAQKQESIWLATVLNGLGRHEMAATTHVVRVIRQRLQRDARELARRKRIPLQSSQHLGGPLMNRTLTTLAAALALLTVTHTALAAKIAIIGTGNVGAALGPEFAALGHTIVYGSRTPNEQDVKDLVAKTGRGATATTQPEAVIVVLAVPGNLAVQITQSLGDLSGKVILDPTNRVNRSSPDGYANHDVPGGSNAELIQAAAPGAKVVKAFNTLNWTKMVDPASSGGPVSIPIVGDDAAARATVAQLVKGMGLEPVDFGPLRFANTLEEMLVIWANAGSHGARFNYYLRPEPPAAPAPAR
jgi:8-hydroxy-5-deazaflavin:NADPH oxidoreductase